MMEEGTRHEVLGRSLQGKAVARSLNEFKENDGGDAGSPHSSSTRHEERRKKEGKSQKVEGKEMAKELEQESSSSSTLRVSASPTPPLPHSLLDLRGTPCPINFVRTKLRLEQMPSGEVLEVWLDPGEPIEQVPDSLTMEGYQVESVEERVEFFSLKVCRSVVS